MIAIQVTATPDLPSGFGVQAGDPVSAVMYVHAAAFNDWRRRCIAVVAGDSLWLLDIKEVQVMNHLTTRSINANRVELVTIASRGR